MHTYDTTYICPACNDYIPMAGYSLQPEDPPLEIAGICPNAECGQVYQFTIGEAGEISVTEI